MYLLTNYKNTHKNIVMTHCYKKCNNNQTWICHFWQTPNPHFSNKPDARYRYKHWTKKWSSWSKWTSRMWTSERVKKLYETKNTCGTETLFRHVCQEYLYYWKKLHTSVITLTTQNINLLCMNLTISAFPMLIDFIFRRLSTEFDLKLGSMQRFMRNRDASRLPGIRTWWKHM